MKADFTELIRAGRVVECYLASALTDIAAHAPCSIFITPKGNDIEAGDIVTLNCSLPYNSGTKAPVVVGDWSPVIFDGITDVLAPDGLSSLTIGTDFELYYAPIAINDR